MYHNREGMAMQYHQRLNKPAGIKSAIVFANSNQISSRIRNRKQTEPAPAACRDFLSPTVLRLALEPLQPDINR
jgi:hypothetical protein